MIIDGHAHACGSYLDSESIAKYLREHNIDMVVLCGGEPNSDRDYPYPMMSNLFKGQGLGYIVNKFICIATRIKGLANHLDEQNKTVYELSRQLPGQVINAYWVNPAEEDCMDKLISHYPIYDFKMVKMHQCWTDFKIDCKRSIEVYKWAAQHKMPIFLHLISREQVTKFVNVANNFTNTTFIVAHMMGVDHICNRLNSTNVYFDLSSPQIYSVRTLERIIRKFGAQRLILGSDTPYGVDNIDKIRDRLKLLSLSEKETDLICGGNLAKLLSLSV